MGILTRTPLRITLGGGGTDLPSYYSKYGGFIFSACIDKYVYVNIKKNEENSRIRLRLLQDEETELLDDIRHELTRETLRMLGIQHGLSVESSADLPAGTGLGSSSSYSVGLLQALHALKGESVSAFQLAEEDFKMEAEILKRPIGKQDPYIAAFGGLTVLTIAKNGAVQVKKAQISGETAKALNQNLMLFYTGITRTADEILHSQSQGIRRGNPDVVENLHRIKVLGYRVLAAIEGGRISEIGHIFDEHWRYKKSTSKSISSGWLDEVYNQALARGAMGGKISGAGGGGFFTFYVEQNHAQFKESMRKLGLTDLEYTFVFEGTTVLPDRQNS